MALLAFCLLLAFFGRFYIEDMFSPLLAIQVGAADFLV